MSEALKLAEWLDKCEPNFYAESSLWLDKVLADNVMYAAIELRRLDAENVRLQAAVAAAVAQERERCVAIVESHQVPVGNSAAGEMAAEWTMDALREIRAAIRDLR